MTSTQNVPGSTLERALLALEKMEAKLAAVERAQVEPLAVVGMACRFPGGVANPGDFWQLMHAGNSAITQISSNRWQQSAESSHPAVQWAGQINDIDQFDASFFGINRNEVIDMDPQHRVLLEVAWEALEDAGIPPETLAGTKTGVFVGISAHDYADLLGARGASAAHPYMATGNAASFAAGRIAYLLGLQGPSLSVDTACSSSLVAFHLACQSLRRGDCDMALVGGVNLLLSPEVSNILASLQILSPDGQCRTFDARANGYVRAEGAAILVLERLYDAQRRSDRILALARGSAMNQNGRSSSLTAPNLLAQAVVIRAALANARVKPEQIGYVEVHSNGSPFGDPVELDALRAAFDQQRADGHTCVLGSVKTFIGHAEAASSMASLIKTVLVLNHDVIPRNLHFESLNPNTSLEGTPFVIPQKELIWKRSSTRRIAGVSATGLSGANVHAVLEEPPVVKRAQDKHERPLHIFLLSGKTPEALKNRAKQMLRHFAAHPDESLGDQCHTLAIGRSHFAHRFAAIVSSGNDAIGQLTDFAESAPSAYLLGRIENLSSRRRTGFIFTGTAAQAIGALGSTHGAPPVFLEALERADAVVHGSIGRHVSSLLEADTRSELPDDAVDDELALFILQYALVESWRSWGIEPIAITGEGTGECVAAWAAGALELNEAIALAIARARFVKSKGRDSDELTKLLPSLPVKTPKQILLLSLGHSHSIASLTTLAYWQSQQATATDFAALLRHLASHGLQAHIEIGPRPDLSKKSNPTFDAIPVLPCVQPRVPLSRTLFEALAALHVRGFEINWAAFDAPYPYRRISLPTYPFQRQRHWFGEAPSAKVEVNTVDGHPILGRTLEARADRPDIRVWETIFGDAHQQTLGMQYILGASVLSSGGVVQIACAAGRELFGLAAWELNLLLADPPTILDDSPLTMQVIATPESDTKATVGLFCRARPGAQWKPFARGTIQVAKLADDEDEEAAPPSMRPGRRQLIAQAMWERRLEAFGVDSEVFRIEQLWRRDTETLASVVVVHGQSTAAFARASVAIASITHPAMHGRWWMIESVEGVTMKVTNANSRCWLRLNWKSNDGATARVSIELINEEGVVAGSARNMTLRAQDPSVVLRAAGKDPIDSSFVDILWKESPLALAASPSKRKWVVLTDHRGVGISLAVQLQAAGDTVITLPAAALDQRIELLDMVLAVSGPFHGVVHLGAIDSATNEPLSITTLDEGLRKSAILAQHIVERLAAQAHVPRLWFVTRGAQPVADSTQSALQAGLWGFGRALSIERPDMWGGLIDLDPHAGFSEASQLAHALANAAGEDHVAVRGGKFYVARLARVHLPGQQSIEIRSDRSYLVTAAQTPLGRAVASWLADRGVRTLILVHRDSNTAPAVINQGDTLNERDELATFRQQGIEIIESRVDVSDVEALRNLLLECRVPLAGIVHTEAANDQGIHRLTGQDAASALQQTVHVKSRSLLGLHETTRHLDSALDFFVTFTSVPARLGWEGLGADSTFAEISEAIVRNHRQTGFPATNVHVSFANEARPGNATIDQEVLAAGFQGMPLTYTIQSMEKIFASGRPAAMATWADWDLFEHTHRARGNRALFAGITEGRRVRTGAAALQRRVAAAEPTQALRMVEDIVRGEVARVLSISASELVSIKHELSGFGMDSIMAVQVLTSISAIFGVSLPTATLLQHPTITSLSLRIIQSIQPSHLAKLDQAGSVNRHGLLIELNGSGSKAPFFFAPPSTGSGIVYRALVEHMSKDRPFYSFSAPGVDTDETPCDRVEVLAARFLEVIRQVQPRGPYRIGGYSLGSLVAYEMAQVLTRTGERVEIVVIGDLPPSRYTRNDPSPLGRLAQIVTNLELDIPSFLTMTPDEQATNMAAAVGNLLNLPPDVAESSRLLRVYRAHLSALHEYCPQPYDGKVVAICAHETVVNVNRIGYLPNDPTLGWGRLCRQPVQAYEIPGDHFSVVNEPDVLAFARTLDSLLDAADT